jgi:hypothetical protein
MKLAEHPTVKRIRQQETNIVEEDIQPLKAAWLRQLVLDAGADDVGFVEIDRPELDDQRNDILQAFPRTKTLISFVVRMNREPIRTPARSVANLEFHHVGDEVNEIGRKLVRTLQDRGVRALNPAMGFPMDMDNFPGKIWVVSHKPVAVAAGLGMMGVHRNVIHQKFGNFILLGTILIDAEVSEYGQPIDYRKQVSDSESASMWQSLSFGANYKAAYCLSVCPAGEDVIGPYLADKKTHLKEIVKPLQEKEETVYVLKNSDAEAHVAKRFPNKRTKHVGNSLRPSSITGFLQGVPLVFQPGKSEGLNATYHFTFTGDEDRQATIVIGDKKSTVEEGHVGEPDLHVTADTKTWLGFLRQERSIVWALLRRKIRLSGPPKLLAAFGKCFPS